MLDPQAALDRLDHALSLAKRLGADAADAIYVGEASTGVQVRNGALEDIGRSEGAEMGLRLFVGTRSASVSTSDLSATAIETLVERAHAMAREAPEDPYAGLAPADRLARGPLADLDLSDGQEPSAELLRARAVETEEHARAVRGVSNSMGASASAGRAVIALATSTGFAGGYASTSHGLSASMIAGEGAAMQRDYAHHGTRHFGELDSPQAIGRKAGERAVARLNPIKLATEAMPVVFDPRVGSSLVGHLIGAITGNSIARRTSFLLDALNGPVFAPGIRIVDQPLRPRGLRSRPFDGEGVAVSETAIVDDGVLTTWLLDSASARQLDLAPTGHATRGIGGPPGAGPTNLHLAPGSLTPDALMADIRRGLYIVELIGQGVNGVTGDYSRGAAGFLIEDGKLGPAVAEVTIAGNLKDMFRQLSPANDLEFRNAVNVPTLRVDGMTVAGA